MSVENKSSNEVVEAWKTQLQENENDYKEIFTIKDYQRFRKRPNRIWQRIFKFIRTKKNPSFFEVGFGGGKNLVQIALAGYKASGIECSADAVKRCQNYIKEAEKISGRVFNIDLILGDFFGLETKEKYDVIFNFGVIEHFLNKADRLNMWIKKKQLLSSGGLAVCYVPSGVHVRRVLMREKKLGGYNIPEVDYSPQSLKEEMEEAGFKNVKVYPIQLFGYLLHIPPPQGFTKICCYLLYYIANYFYKILPDGFRIKHGYNLLAIGEI